MKILNDHEGRAIRLTDERLAHILEHPEMQGMEGRIGDNDAFILTAYLVRQPAGGRQLWPKRN